jgi:hypothetical protein
MKNEDEDIFIWIKTNIFVPQLSKDPCKPSLPLLAKTTATWGPFTAIKLYFFTATFTAIFWLHFLPLSLSCFFTQILLLLVFLLLRLCLFLLVSLPKAGVPVAAGIPTVANIPAVSCFPAVAGVSKVGLTE